MPVVPIYIQEKIHPQALMEKLRDAAAEGEAAAAAPEPTLFADFNGLQDFAEKVDFYRHEGHWQNRMILGDSLLVMTSLAEKEALKGKVQMIYLDPPYGIKFGSNWQVSTRKREVRDGKAEDATRQPEQIRAFRDTWQLGIHSYLTYLRDRLTVARDMLTETASIFVQIGDENVHVVRSVMDEVFGADNKVALITVWKSGMMMGNLLKDAAYYLVWYAKEKERIKYRQLLLQKQAGIGAGDVYTWVESPDGTKVRRLTGEEIADPSTLARGWRAFRLMTLTTGGYRVNTTVEYGFDGRTFHPGQDKCWRTTVGGLDRLALVGGLVQTASSLNYKAYVDDFPAVELSNIWTDTGTGGSEGKIYAVQTPTKVIERCALMTTDPGDLVLDPTCGSGTSAYLAEHWGRRWITIDTSRVALALARTRLMAAKYPYYVLADSAEGVQKQAGLAGKLPPTTPRTDDDIRKGFVYKRVPHVTLKSIANNPDIREGMKREQIDAAIARHADTEILYDQPVEDAKRMRVSGPFTVESLSPHRVLAVEEELPVSEEEGRRASAAGQFETTIIENLRAAGVQNTRKKERLKFDRLDPHAGTWIHAVGEFADSDGKTRRAATSIGPEHGTVGPQQVKEAAKEAVQGVGFDVLIVCGFAFDPHVAEEAKRYGKLTVLPARMNPDLAMGEELLKKTGTGNLFMVFGEPDVEIRRTKDKQVQVTLNGVDVYDPTTGEIRNSSTDDIACWFIDTNYNGESFFVRHAYFTGGDDPFEKLKRALRAEIDEAAWSSLYGTTSRPFDPPETKKIAVKVINHYGDEVLKVFET